MPIRCRARSVLATQRTLANDPGACPGPISAGIILP